MAFPGDYRLWPQLSDFPDGIVKIEPVYHSDSGF